MTGESDDDASQANLPDVHQRARCCPGAAFLSNAFSGLAGIGLDESVAATTLCGRVKSGAALRQFPAKAKRVLQIFCPGGASHIDLWDHKPALEKYHGKPLPGEERLRHVPGQERQPHEEPVAVPPAGQSGKMISTLLPHVARHVDDIAFIHSMQSKTNTHGPGCVFMNTGSDLRGLPGRRRVDRLRPGQRERKPAGVRRDSRHPRRAAQRQSELEQRLSAGPASGGRDGGPAADAQSRGARRTFRPDEEQRRATSCDC